MQVTEEQLTYGNYGHCLHNTQCFSKDDDWLVYDTRNADSKIGSTCSVEIVNTLTGNVKEIYRTANQTSYGPGVGAASFSPVCNTVVFIHGVRNCDMIKPYSFTRRTAVAVQIGNPYEPVFMDARNIRSPYTTGALRGGTHAHQWSSDGQWLSFTYDDYVMELASVIQNTLPFKRTVGIMIPDYPVMVAHDETMENHSGKMFSFIIAKLFPLPKWGSDEIDMAFDEGWIGANGYIKPDNTRQNKAIAFQGNVYDLTGKNKTELFVIDLPDAFTEIHLNNAIRGSRSTPPLVPQGISQRRITFSANGIDGPRHWLRSTCNGEIIGYLNKDAGGIVQLFGISPNGGYPRQITCLKHSIQGPFNFSANGRYAAYLSNNNVYITELLTGRSEQLTDADKSNTAIGAVVWSNRGDMLAYNRYISSNAGTFLQIFIIRIAAQN